MESRKKRIILLCRNLATPFLSNWSITSPVMSRRFTVWWGTSYLWYSSKIHNLHPIMTKKTIMQQWTERESTKYLTHSLVSCRGCKCRERLRNWRRLKTGTKCNMVSRMLEEQQRINFKRSLVKKIVKYKKVGSLIL